MGSAGVTVSFSVVANALYLSSRAVGGLVLTRTQCQLYALVVSLFNEKLITSPPELCTQQNVWLKVAGAIKCWRVELDGVILGHWMGTEEPIWLPAASPRHCDSRQVGLLYFVIRFIRIRWVNATGC